MRNWANWPVENWFLMLSYVQGSYRCLKVLEFFSRFSRPGKSLKTDMVLKVLESVSEGP